MISQSNIVLSFILIALGCIGITLSYLVPDRKKSLIALGMAGVIILVGVINLASSATESWRWRRRLQALRQQAPQVDMQKLQEEFKKKAEEAQSKMKTEQKKQP